MWHVMSSVLPLLFAIILPTQLGPISWVWQRSMDLSIFLGKRQSSISLPSDSNFIGKPDKYFLVEVTGENFFTWLAWTKLILWGSNNLRIVMVLCIPGVSDIRFKILSAHWIHPILTDSNRPRNSAVGRFFTLFVDAPLAVFDGVWRNWLLKAGSNFKWKSERTHLFSIDSREIPPVSIYRIQILIPRDIVCFLFSYVSVLFVVHWVSVLILTYRIMFDILQIRSNVEVNTILHKS